MKHIIRSTGLAALLALVLTPAMATSDETESVDRQIKRDQWFATLDLNNDGYISEEEFVQAQVQRAEENARRAFARLDEHNKGEISAEDFNAFIDQRFEDGRARAMVVRERFKNRAEHPRRGERSEPRPRTER